MRIHDRLVTSFFYEENEYKINLAFDVVLIAFDVLSDHSLRDYEKADICLALLLDEKIDDDVAVEVWNHVYEKFVHIEREDTIQYDLKGNPLPVQEEEKATIDFDKDGEMIFASFMEAYGMNLIREHGVLQWAEFRALLNGLPSSTIIQRVQQIRAWEPSKGDSPEYIKQMVELKKIHSIHDENT